MKVRDAIRAQFYLPFVEQASSRVREELKRVGSAAAAVESLLEDFRTDLSAILDDVFIPTAVFIVSSARSKGNLSGLTPEERYRSAFLKDKEWTDDARETPANYQLLFDQMASLAAAMASDVVRCLRSLADTGQINKEIHPRGLERIVFTSGDRHAVTGQPLLLIYQNGGRYIYKWGDHRYYQVVPQIADRVLLPISLRLRFPHATFFDDFALIEYIVARPPSTFQEARELYQNFGVLIAFMDFINYCDGHFENVIIAGSCPVAVDLETIFHSFEPALREGEERSILYTGLIQIPPKSLVDEGFSSPMQMPTGFVHELAKPIAVNDRTEDISLRYRGLLRRFSEPNSAIAGYKIEDHVPDVEFGYAACFEAFMCRRSELLADGDLWDSIVNIRLRQVMRTTLYYLYLMRRNQMPDIAGSPSTSREWFFNGLAAEPKLMAFEMYELQRARIPIFFHLPGSRDLSDAYNGVYRGHLPTKSVDEVRDRWRGLNQSYCARSLELIRRNLSTTLSLTSASPADVTASAIPGVG